LNGLEWNPVDCWFIPWDIRQSKFANQNSGFRIHGPLVQNWYDLITDNGQFNGNGRHSTIYPTRSEYVFHQEQTTDSYVMHEGSRYRCIQSHFAGSGQTPADTNYWQYVDDTTTGNPPSYSTSTYYYSMDPLSSTDSDGLPSYVQHALPTNTPPVPCRSFDDPDQVNVLSVRWENLMTAPYIYLNGVYLGQAAETQWISYTGGIGNYFRTDKTSLQLAANNPNGVVLGADSNDYSNNNGAWSLCEMAV